MNPSLKAPVSKHVVNGAAREAFKPTAQPAKPTATVSAHVVRSAGRIVGGELSMHINF